MDGTSLQRRLIGSFRAAGLALLCAAAPGMAQSPAPPGQTPDHPEGWNLMAPITSPLGRAALDLGGAWRHIPDPYDNGSVSHLSRPLADGWWMDRRPASAGERVEYSFDGAAEITVPGDWNSQREDLFFYEGTVWYRRAFEFHPTPGKRRFVHFGAVNRHADVWLNGEFLGSHHVGFTPFAFEITGKLRDGENSLVVRVDNRRRPEDVPAMRTDWWNYGGITREVTILEAPETFIRAWAFRLSPDRSTLHATVRLDGADRAGMSCAIRVEPVPGVVRGVADESGTIRVEIPWPEGAALWSAQRPALHGVSIEAENGDRVTDRIGFRTIQTRGREILLNGEPVFLRGICLHEEAPDRAGRAWSEADARRLLGWAKELGCNYVRLAHYTHNEHMLRVADELGLMVWAEIPVYWVLDFDNPATRAYARTHLTEMIERDRNRASVVIWSVGNENEGNEAQTSLRRELAQTARELDDTRLISAACFVRMTRGADGRLDGVFVEDPFGAFADVLAINEYIGWYHDSTEQLAGLPVQTAWEKPLIFSEFGAGVKQGRAGGPEEVWSEAFGVRFYRDQLAWCDELRRSGMLQGLSPWILKDFRSPRRPLAGVQDWYNRKGLISESGVRKRVFDVVRRQYEAWTDEPAPVGEE